MNVHAIGVTFFNRKLTNGFQKRETFIISHSAANLYNGNLCVIGLGIQSNVVLDHIGDMGNHLDRRAGINSVTLIFNDGMIYFSRSHITMFIQILIDKSFIMTNIQISFATVFSNKYFSVLVGVHGSGIHIQVRI